MTSLFLAAFALSSTIWFLAALVHYSAYRHYRVRMARLARQQWQQGVETPWISEEI